MVVIRIIVVAIKASLTTLMAILQIITLEDQENFKMDKKTREIVYQGNTLGFKTSLSDTSLFVKVDGNDIILLLLYMDDIIVTSSSTTKIQVVIQDLAEYKDDGSLFITQLKYTKELQKKAGMESCKSTSTPSKPHTQLLEREGIDLADPTQYRSIVGALQYLTFTRPDIAHAVNMVCQFLTKPTDLHFHLVKRILRYLKGTIECGPKFNLTVYSDSDWAADINTRRSITEPPLLQCDNLSALTLSSNPIFHSKIKHLDTDYHFVWEKVQKGDLVVQYIPTEDQIADVFTKGLHNPMFLKHCKSLGLGVSD
ncbi:unnamed protein product [Malus baccata var. baccata]